jgi:hypothetical protein
MDAPPLTAPTLAIERLLPAAGLDRMFTSMKTLASLAACWQ